MVSKYFDCHGFNEQFNKAIKTFMQTHGLSIYEAIVSKTFLMKQKGLKFGFPCNELVSIVSMGAMLTHTSSWSMLQVEEAYQSDLVDHLYHNIDTALHEALHQTICRFMRPEVVAQGLYQLNLPLLEEFLKTKKVSNSLGWQGKEIFSYMEPILHRKKPPEQLHYVQEVLKNNFLPCAKMNMAVELQEFAGHCLSLSNPEILMPFYEQFTQSYTSSQSIFSQPPTVTIIDLNKQSMVAKYGSEQSGGKKCEAWCDKMVTSLAQVIKQSGLGVEHAELIQKNRTYPQWRLVLDTNGKENRQALEQFIEAYIDNYHQVANNQVLSSKECLAIAKNVVLWLNLNENLPVRVQEVAKRKKI